MRRSIALVGAVRRKLVVDTFEAHHLLIHESFLKGQFDLGTRLVGVEIQECGNERISERCVATADGFREVFLQPENRVLAREQAISDVMTTGINSGVSDPVVERWIENQRI